MTPPCSGLRIQDKKSPQRAAWLIGINVCEYREIVAGDRMPSLRTYERIAELYGWPERFEGQVKSG
jgi:hypothetical protein